MIQAAVAVAAAFSLVVSNFCTWAANTNSSLQHYVQKRGCRTPSLFFASNRCEAVAPPPHGVRLCVYIITRRNRSSVRREKDLQNKPTRYWAFDVLDPAHLYASRWISGRVTAPVVLLAVRLGFVAFFVVALVLQGTNGACCHIDALVKPAPPSVRSHGRNVCAWGASRRIRLTVILLDHAIHGLDVLLVWTRWHLGNSRNGHIPVRIEQTM